MQSTSTPLLVNDEVRAAASHDEEAAKGLLASSPSKGKLVSVPSSGSLTGVRRKRPETCTCHAPGLFWLLTGAAVVGLLAVQFLRLSNRFFLGFRREAAWMFGGMTQAMLFTVGYARV